ncbi:Uncharacterized protein BM_BM5445 [Brugia malayi]|uniref:Bm5445 n=2 Tax=Brugia TaxID=6278 RepID=A0A0H5S705_BRUMA|nr:Uncharacterized protein BM_BM5445 [Brugia malayi]CRZ24390.1 Bm5445 [Brugia malayi]VIO89025.1 Uncharacterized protein BM_BM5445 [Brugia malayi]
MQVGIGCYTICLFGVIQHLLNLSNGAIRQTHPIELTIDSGSIRGEYLTIGANDFAVFKGIPYAAPPVGSLRFQMPEPPAKWRGVMNATQYSAMCAQKPRTRQTDPVNIYRIHISEDCLYLNVFAPPQFTNDTYPVIVYIHGGEFQSGSSSDLSQEAILTNFVSRKIVFISINYRLGPLGFISTGDGVIPGNNGLWDQILALKWVKLNAQAFGGDPENVLLMGHGSGAASVSLLALSPRAEGLFQKIALLSGTALSPGAVRDTAVNATWILDRKLHCRSFNSSELLECFKKQLKDEILDTSAIFIKFHGFQYLLKLQRIKYDDYEEFVPIVDGIGGILPESPEMLATYRRKMPMMIGTTRDESSLKILILNEKNTNMNALTRAAAEEMAENLTLSYSGFINHRLIMEGCKHEYIWSKINPAVDSSVLNDAVLNMYSHFWYDAPASRLATHYAKGGAPVYLYSFDHISENFDHDRAFHGCDEIFLFDVEPRFLVKRRDRNWQLDRRLTEIFAELIINFARTGPEMNVGFRWQGHVFWNWYARHLDSVDVGNLHRIAQLDKQLGDYQLATWMLLFCALFFFAILVGLACYCTRKEADDEDL